MSGGRARLADAAKPALMLAALVAAGFVLRLPPAGGAAGLLEPRGGATVQAVSLVAVGALLCAVGLPRQVVCYAAGLAFGTVAGFALALVAQLLGCAAAFGWARLMGRAFVAARMGGRLARLDAAVTARPFGAILALRLLPVGNNLVLNLLAGVSGISALPFLAASAVGYLPQTAVFALAGGGTQVGHVVQLGLAAALLALSAALGLALWRRETAGLRPAGVPSAATPSRAIPSP